LIFPFLEDIVIGVECVFCWYWIADLCAQHSLPFVLGHALYMKAIHTLRQQEWYIEKTAREHD
jgi:hypothetical protein